MAHRSGRVVKATARHKPTHRRPPTIPHDTHPPAAPTAPPALSRAAGGAAAAVAAAAVEVAHVDHSMGASFDESHLIHRPSRPGFIHSDITGAAFGDGPFVWCAVRTWGVAEICSDHCCFGLCWFFQPPALPPLTPPLVPTNRPTPFQSPLPTGTCTVVVSAFPTSSPSFPSHPSSSPHPSPLNPPAPFIPLRLSSPASVHPRLG